MTEHFKRQNYLSDFKRKASIILGLTVTLTSFGSSFAQNSHNISLTCHKTSDNGIVVGQTKIFDESSLRIMLQGTEESLQRIQAINPSAVANAVTNVQGQREADSSLAVSASTLPGVILGRQNKPPQSDTVAPTIPTPPSQLSVSPGQQSFGLSSEDLLAEQMSLSYQVINLRLLLERSLTDRILKSPTVRGAEVVDTRAQTVVGFQVSIDSKSKYKDAVAEVEVSIIPKAPDDQPSLVSLIPKDKTYNVVTVTKKSKVFNAGALIQLMSVGASASSSKADVFLVRDTDTVALERAAPHHEKQGNDCTDPQGLTFAWQFRPVLDRKAVDTGARQVFALLSLPIENRFGVKFDAEVTVHTHWRRYDSGRGTVGDIIAGSSNFQTLNSLTTRAGGYDAPILGPRVDSVKWSPADNGQVLVQVGGKNFLPGTRVTFGDKVLDSPASGLIIQNENLMILKMPGSQLALLDNPLVIGRYGPAVALRNRLRSLEDMRQDQSVNSIPSDFASGIPRAEILSLEPIDAQTTRVTLEVTERRQFKGESYDTNVPKFIYQPVVIVGSTVFGMPGNLRVREVRRFVVSHDRSNSSLERITDVTLELTFSAPTSLLRDAGGVGTVKEMFFGDNFSKEIAFNLGADDFTATEVIVLSSSADTATFAIRGTRFDKNNEITVTVGGAEPFSQMRGTLKVLSSTLLSFTTTPSAFKGVKNLLINQRPRGNPNADGTTVVLALPAPPTVPKPVFDKIDPVNEGDITTINIKGSNLNSIDSGQFQGENLKAKPEKDGKSMTIEVSAALSSKAGKKDMRFTLKNGDDFVYTLTVEKK